jgi:hypothetical protein
MRTSTQLNKAIIDYYRCPESLLDFKLKGSLSADEGFFRFGQSVCYGRSCSGHRSSQAKPGLYDVLPDVSTQNGRAMLPFNPSEVIDNLRLERYTGSGRACRGAKSAYYALRPLLSAGIRRRIKKLRLLGWRDIPFPEWPVDRTVENICEQLLLLSLQVHKADKIPFVWFWPRGAHGCIMMTHDVETVSGRDACAQVMDLDDSFGIKASFEIVPEERYDVPREFLEAMRRRGFEVSVQDLNHDGKLFDQHDRFLCRATKINQYAAEYGATAFRSAVLYRQPEWYDAFQIAADMSIPNVAHLDPQRGGCCTVMPYFIGNVIELPVTTTQDYMLFYLLDERSINLWKRQTSMVLAKCGLVSFIVHPDYLGNGETRSLYLDLLTYLQGLRSSTDVWFALPHEIDHWWRLRSQMTVVSDGTSWRISGEGSDQAVLAYAAYKSRELTYSIPSSELA